MPLRPSPYFPASAANSMFALDTDLFLFYGRKNSIFGKRGLTREVSLIKLAPRAGVLIRMLFTLPAENSKNRMMKMNKMKREEDEVHFQERIHF